MSAPRKRAARRPTPAEHEMRDQEVLRANRELAAYFKGRRTEREARAALKIIKAFVRDRAHADPASRRPLPGIKAAPAPERSRPKTTARKPGRRKPRPARGAATPAAGNVVDITTPPPFESDES